MSHADPEFYEQFSFCRIECDECQRLDAEWIAENGTDKQFEQYIEGLRLAMIALDAEELPELPT